MRRQHLLLPLVLAALVGCPSDPISDDSGPETDDSDPPDTQDTDSDGPFELALATASQVSQDEIEASITALEGLGTRYTYTDGDDQAVELLADKLTSYGLVAEQDPFVVGSEPVANIIARKEGVEEPDVVWIFSAHYDSTSNQAETAAPGADDNASGVAAVLEAARILAPMQFRHSLWFVFTGAEEQGSLGSAHMVEWLATEGVEVRGVIAPDMIAYWPLEDGDAFDILGDSGSQHLSDQMAEVADALGVAYKAWNNHNYCYGDDHTNFQEAGIPAISPMDCVEAHNVSGSGESLPHYHRTTDTLETLYLPFTTEVVRVIVATFAWWGEPVAG